MAEADGCAEVFRGDANDVGIGHCLANPSHGILDARVGAAIDDGGAGARQSFRCGTADAGGGIGNDGLAAGQIDDLSFSFSYRSPVFVSRT